MRNAHLPAHGRSPDKRVEHHLGRALGGELDHLQPAAVLERQALDHGDAPRNMEREESSVGETPDVQKLQPLVELDFLERCTLLECLPEDFAERSRTP